MKITRIAILLTTCLWTASAFAAEPEPAPTGSQEKTPPPATAQALPDQQVLHERFSELLSGVKLVGHFTVRGKQDTPPAQEEYTIRSVTKLDEGNLWLFRTRIKYGQHDVAVPLALEVKWAGDTPVITLTEFAIPTLGTFSSRVVLYDNLYAGTWSHGKVGGHLFGTIEKLPPDDQQEGAPKDQPAK